MLEEETPFVLKAEFDAAVDQLLVRFGGSLTSGRRTDARAIAVGGFAGDPHTWGLGADVIWDARPDEWVPAPWLVTEQTASPFALAVARAGLTLIRESNHDHFQPRDFPAGPVTAYGGVTRPVLGHD